MTRLIKRASSSLAMGDPGLPTVDAADAVRRLYAARGRPALVQGELGSTTETGNAPAPALYDGLGFRRHHTCRHLRVR